MVTPVELSSLNPRLEGHRLRDDARDKYRIVDLRSLHRIAWYCQSQGGWSNVDDAHVDIDEHFRDRPAYREGCLTDEPDLSRYDEPAVEELVAEEPPAAAQSPEESPAEEPPADEWPPDEPLAGDSLVDDIPW